jgi:molybdopterin converting factor small subunit
MATVRLFARLREIAGADRVELDGATVESIRDAAAARFGEEFAAAMAGAQVWVDGVRVPAHSAVAEGAEVAILPPVSGGAFVVRSPVTFEFGLVLAFTAGLTLANFLSIQWLAVVTVLLMTLWAYDIVGTGERRGLFVGSVPIHLGVVGGVLATYRFGAAGMAAAMAGTVMLGLTWGVLREHLRDVDSIAGTALLGLAGCIGASSLMLIRLRSRDEALVFLVIALAAIVVAWLSDRSEMPIVDPMIGMILGGLLAGLAASALWAPTVSTSVMASVAAVAGLVAGRTVGMLVRAGGYFGGSDLPGSLGYFDGVVLAAGSYGAVLLLMG